MGDGSLSQDEIDKLLLGADDVPNYASSSSASSGGADDLTPLDRDTLTDILANAFTSVEGTLTTILSKNVKLTNPIPESKSAADISSEIGAGSVCLFSTISGGINGKVCMVFSMENGAKIASAYNGGLSGGVNEEAQIKSLKDCFTSAFGRITIQIGDQIHTQTVGSPLEGYLSKNAKDLQLPDGKTIIRTSVNMNVEGVGSFKLHYILSKSMVDDIINLSRRGAQKNGHSDSNGGMNVNIPQNFGTNQSAMHTGGQQIGIKGVSFPNLATAGPPSGQTNLNLLMDVQMSLTVELGRTKMYIKDILGLGEGSIIELDKLAGEPVDLLVNGKLIAKGEVVVIDENFGVRVTDIVSPTDRIKNEQKT